MSARQPRFEVVRSDGGWFARFVGGNGRKVWQTETYRRRIDAVRAVEMVRISLFPHDVRTVDERSA